LKKSHTYGVLILAGGMSKRMNYPKPWLTVNNGITFLEHLVRFYYGSGFRDICTVLNHKFYSKTWRKSISNVKQHSLIFENKQPEKGRLHSIKSGLAKLTDNDYVIIQNVDNPYIDNNTVDTLINNVSPDGVTIPTYHGKGGHPVIISDTITDYILNTKINREKLSEVFDKFKKQYVEVKSKNILYNINTPSEYKKLVSEFVQ
jgi:molybdenum cofactor cytidylyltransferase